LDVEAGDLLLAIDDLPVGGTVTPAERLVDQAGNEVILTLRRGDAEPRTVTVKAIRDERALYYWICWNSGHPTNRVLPSARGSRRQSCRRGSERLVVLHPSIPFR